MRKIAVDVTVDLSIGDLHYIENFVNEYTDESVIEQALIGVSEENLQETYYQFLLNEFVRESILTGRCRYEDLEVLISEFNCATYRRQSQKPKSQIKNQFRKSFDHAFLGVGVLKNLLPVIDPASQRLQGQPRAEKI